MYVRGIDLKRRGSPALVVARRRQRVKDVLAPAVNDVVALYSEARRYERQRTPEKSKEPSDDSATKSEQQIQKQRPHL